MSEWMWLLLPAALSAGWWLGRRGCEGHQASEGASGGQFATRYFQGLNYVLNEQPDKAIEVFCKIMEVDNETLETHYALGNLFRRRGEVDRAIRIHQNLIARPSLDKRQRALALLELGLDYMRAGLFDRAENLFKELVDMRLHVRQAQENLLAIYEQEKDWENAIRTARQLHGDTSRNMYPVIAQYHCELAEQAVREGRVGDVVAGLDKALAVDANCVRASLLLGQVESKAGRWKAALKAYHRVVQQDIDYVAEVLEPMRACYKALDNPAGMRVFLSDLLGRYDGISPVLAMTDWIVEHEGEAAAAAFIVEQTRTKPSVRGIDRFVELRLPHAAGEFRENLMTVRQLAQGLLASRPTYACSNCGFRARALHWHCPGCQSWATIKPIRGVEAE